MHTDLIMQIYVQILTEILLIHSRKMFTNDYKL